MSKHALRAGRALEAYRVALRAAVTLLNDDGADAAWTAAINAVMADAGERLAALGEDVGFVRGEPPADPALN